METRPLIVFDAMGVLYRDPDDVASCLIPFLAERGVRGRDDEIKESYREASLGTREAREFWERFGLGSEYPRIQESYLSTRIRFDPRFIGAASALSGKYDIAMLSNDVGEWSRALRRLHGIEGFFSFALVSSDEGARKPDPAVFRALLARAGRSPASCLMIDDRLANLEPAAALGMRTALYGRDEAAAREWGLRDRSFEPDILIPSMESLPTAVDSLFGR